MSALNDRYTIDFEVWRPTETDDCYSFVGSNYIPDVRPGLAHNVQSCIVLDVPEDDQIEVEPGDVVGFYVDHIGGSRAVLLDGENYDDFEMWYRRISNPSQSDLEGSPLCIGEGQNLSIQCTEGAPVITAVIGKDLLHGIGLY